MCTHMMSHQGNCCCNRKLKNVTLTENWKEVKCKLCQRTEQYFMARQDSPKEPLSACGKTLDEFMAACNDDCSNIEFQDESCINFELDDNHDCFRESVLWQKSDLPDSIIHFGLDHYRIKEPTPTVVLPHEAIDWNEKAYTITETQLNELIEIAEHGDECKVEYSSLEQMTEDALALTSECIRVILKEFNWIRGGVNYDYKP